jgi:hypothetical protein
MQMHPDKLRQHIWPHGCLSVDHFLLSSIMPNHSRIDLDAITDSLVLDDGFHSSFLELTTEEQTAFIADLAARAKITAAAIKKAKVELPSFSHVKWAQVAEVLDTSALDLETFQILKYRLPPSFHEIMFKNAWRCQDVYCEMVDHQREEVSIRLCEPACQPNSHIMHCTDKGEGL